MSGYYDQVAETLSRLDIDWKLREEGLAKLQARLEEGRADAFDFLNARGAKLLALQLSDLRSGVVRGAAETIQAACQGRVSSKHISLESFAESVIREPNTFKAVGNGNKLIATYAGKALVALFESRCVPFSALEGFLNFARGNKNPQIRERVAQCLSIYASQGTLPTSRRTRPVEIAEFFSRAGELFIRDASANVRSFAKRIRGFSPLGEETMQLADQSKDTADESEPQRPSKANPKPQTHAPDHLTMEMFKALADEAEGAHGSEQREEARIYLLKADLRPLMPELLRVAARMEVPTRSRLLFLVPAILKHASVTACAELYLKESSLSTLLFLKHQLSTIKEDIPFSFYKKVAEAVSCTLACKPSSLPLLRAHAETLCLLSKSSDFSNLNFANPNLAAALETVRDLGLDLNRPIVAASASVTDEAMRKVGCETHAESPVCRSAQTSKSQGKSIQEKVSDKREVSTFVEQQKDSTPLKYSFDEFLKAFCKCSRESRDQVCEAAISFGKPALFYELLEEELSSENSPANKLVDVMKFAMCVYKQLPAKKEKSFFLDQTLLVLDEFVGLLKNYVFSHSEVVVRKTTVQLLVSLYHLVGEKEFERVLYHFATEQQRLIQVYIKKSLE